MEHRRSARFVEKCSDRIANCALALLAVGLFTRIDAKAEAVVQVPEKATLTSVEEQNAHREVRILHANEEEKISDKKVYELQIEGRIPVLFIPYGSANDSKVVVDAPKVSDLISQANQKEVDDVLSQVMGRLNFIQSLIQKRKLDDALSNLTLLQSIYPHLHFLEFTKASIYLLQGNRELALRTALSALKYLPENEEGKAFVKALQEVKP